MYRSVEYRYPMLLDLADLSSIRPAAIKFLENEHRPDVLFHNAAVMQPPKGSTSKHVRWYCYPGSYG